MCVPVVDEAAAKGSLFRESGGGTRYNATGPYLGHVYKRAAGQPTQMEDGMPASTFQSVGVGFHLLKGDGGVHFHLLKRHVSGTPTSTM